MQKMDIASFLKCVSELPSLIPLSVTAKLVVLLPRVFDEKLADFPFRIGKIKKIAIKVVGALF